MSVAEKARKITTNTLQEMKDAGEKITMLTAYDFSLAKLVDNGGVDVILVGDSASNVMAGNETTVPITLDHMIYHAQCVVRAVDRALIVVDMPFGSYQGNSILALESAIRIMKESGGHAVKLEGGAEIVDSVKRILTYTVRAREEEEAEKLIADAKMLEEAGCFAIVLEKIPAGLATKVSQAISIPTIGIGAGAGVDGQVLVLHDMLGITMDFSPRFLRRYLNLSEQIEGAINDYVDDVRSGEFPSESEQY
jgi:3-methyl-2-oxobutanoate hydroxymethyltransferase